MDTPSLAFKLPQLPWLHIAALIEHEPTPSDATPAINEVSRWVEDELAAVVGAGWIGLAVRAIEREGVSWGFYLLVG